MGYEHEYIQSIGNKQKFMDLMRKHYSGIIKETTMERRYYDCKKKIGIVKIYQNNDTTKPDMFKMLTINDMMRFNKVLTRKYLSKYNFNTYELNWLEEKGYLNE